MYVRTNKQNKNNYERVKHGEIFDSWRHWDISPNNYDLIIIIYYLDYDFATNKIHLKKSEQTFLFHSPVKYQFLFHLQSQYFSHLCNNR